MSVLGSDLKGKRAFVTGGAVGIAGKNLSDEKYLTNGYNIPSLGILQGAYGNPRMVTATLEFSFF